MDDESESFPLRRSLRRIVAGGCLAMVYITGTSSPAATEFFRAIGLNEFHFGLLSGIPLTMLFVQFLGALACSKLRGRKAPFLVLNIVGRLLYVPVALIPLCFASLDSRVLVVSTIVLLSLNQALTNFVVPLWYSWMADVIPPTLVNRFWGNRHWWMQLTWTLSYVAIAGVSYYSGLSIKALYAALALAGTAAGVLDILLFLPLPDPPPVPSTQARVSDVLLEPLRHRVYRTFVGFTCAWQVGVNFFAPFTQLYAFEKLDLTPWQLILMWCMYGAASVATARFWGHVSQRRGNRPVFTICVWGKSLVVIVMMLVTPATVLAVLPATFFFDGILNSGFAIATNGYMFKIAPKANRSMFVAAITGLAGICGGLSAMAAGWVLHSLAGRTWPAFGRTWDHYHAVFLISVLLRWVGIVMAHRIREPKSARTLETVGYLLDFLPSQFLSFAGGVYRRLIGTRE